MHHTRNYGAVCIGFTRKSNLNYWMTISSSQPMKLCGGVFSSGLDQMCNWPIKQQRDWTANFYKRLGCVSKWLGNEKPFAFSS